VRFEDLIDSGHGICLAMMRFIANDGLCDEKAMESMEQASLFQ
jgi:hypothetical protein